jgi:hypothetical protein
MTRSRLGKALQNFVVKVRDRREYGRLPSSVDMIVVPERPDYVRVIMDSGTQTQALNKGMGRVPLRANLPVKLLRRADGELVVDGEDDTLLENDTGEPSNDYGVPAHPISIHTDVDINTPTTGQALVYNGTAWVNDTVLADVGAAIEAATVKTAPVGADNFGITDSEDSAILKKLSWSNIVVGIIAEVGLYIAALAAKVTPVDADSIVITDSAASGAPKRVTFTNITTYIMAKITALATKTPPVGADAIVITDSAAADVPKRLTFTNLITYLTTLYMDLTTAQTVATGIKTFTPGIVSPSVDGSVIANGDLTLQGTTHATRTTSYVILQPNGGPVVIGDTAPITAVHFSVVAPAARLGVRSTNNSQNSSFLLYAKGASGTESTGGLYYTGHETPASRFFGLSADNVSFHMVIMSDGLVGIGTLAPSGKLSVQAGTSTDHANVGGVLSANITTVGNVGTGADNLMTFAIPANTLAVNGQSIWFEAIGHFVNNANAKTFTLNYGATILGTIAGSGGVLDFNFRGRIWRTGAATQRAWCEYQTTIGTPIGFYTTPAETLSGAVTIKGVGTATANNDITMVSFIIGMDDVNS